MPESRNQRERQDVLIPETAAAGVPLWLVPSAALPDWLAEQPTRTQAWVKAQGFTAAAGECLTLPGADGALAGAIVGRPARITPFAPARLSKRLPSALYRLASADLSPAEQAHLALGWRLGMYTFDALRRDDATAPAPAQLILPAGVDAAHIARLARGTELTRDLVNMPANHLGPAALADAARQTVAPFTDEIIEIVGDALLTEGFPAVHVVGHGSERAPRLLDVRWGDPNAPKVTLVGKGVVFDTGGYNLKPTGGMELMKKDMGGAAHALAVAWMLMDAGTPVRGRLLLPIVENSISGRAFRPLDIINTRDGSTVEVGNTDAEGRLILADALTAGAEDKPAIMIDFATLTGAARVALGPELTPLFATDPSISQGVEAAGQAAADLVWPMPLHEGYRAAMKSKLADISSTGSLGQAGAITAALFLRHFVPDGVPWAHIDIFAWNQSSANGRAEGGEAWSARAVFGYLHDRFSDT